MASRIFIEKGDIGGETVRLYSQRTSGREDKMQSFKEWSLTGFMAIILAIGLGKFLIVGPLSSTEMNIGAAATVGTHG
jgi:hypothetical protein